VSEVLVALGVSHGSNHRFLYQSSVLLLHRYHRISSDQGWTFLCVVHRFHLRIASRVLLLLLLLLRSFGLLSVNRHVAVFGLRAPCSLRCCHGFFILCFLCSDGRFLCLDGRFRECSRRECSSSFDTIDLKGFFVVRLSNFFRSFFIRYRHGVQWSVVFFSC